MKVISVVVAVLAFAVGIGIARHYLPTPDPVLDTSGNSRTKVPVTPGRFGGDFTLRQGDRPVSLSDFRGKLVIMYFGYASCPDVCPTTLTIIASALRNLTAEEMADVQPVFISVDPERDKGENLSAYAAHFHPDFIGITGSPEEVQRVANQYGGFFIKVDSDSAMDYLVDHTSKTYIVSKDGRYVNILPHDMTSDDVLSTIRGAL